MKNRFTLFRRGHVFYSEDSATGQQLSLRTKDETEALALLQAKNEAHRQPALNVQMAQAYMSASDPEAMKRTWQTVMDEYVRTKHGNTQVRCDNATKDKALLPLKAMRLVETQPADFLRALEAGSVVTNVYLRRFHSFALGMNWLPKAVLPQKQWPAIHYGDKRGITSEEHVSIVEAARNPEHRAYYEMCWHLGGSQSDVAGLKAADIDWENRVVSFFRAKTKAAQIIQVGTELERVLRGLPSEGPLFPKLGVVTESRRAAEFKRACRNGNVEGVTLHSYRYAWAERAKTSGYPERFAQIALGHASKAVHRAYAKKAHVVLPSLEDFEKRQNDPAMVPIAAAVA